MKLKEKLSCYWNMMQDTFSRAFAEFSESQLAERVHKALIKQTQSGRLVGHISRDSTAIEAREKAIKKEEPPKTSEPPKKRGRPKKGEKPSPKDPTRLEKQVNMTLEEMLKDLPSFCDVGTKKNSKDYKISWKGYKLHIDTADGMIPISAVLTSASMHDSQAAIPLSLMTHERVINFYDLMDAAYDAQIIREHSQSLGHVPLIDFNRRSPKDQRDFLPHEEQSATKNVVLQSVSMRV